MNTITIYFFVVPILTIILLFANIFLAVHRPDSEKVTPYECGFSPIYGQTRNPFEISFFKVGLIFLVLDIEILISFPYGTNIYEIGQYGYWIFTFFFFILTIGFVFEIASGALYFYNNPNKNKLSNLI